MLMTNDESIEGASRHRVNKLKMENAELKESLTRSRRITKALLLVLYETGVLNEGKSVLSLFKDVIFFKICRVQM